MSAASQLADRMVAAGLIRRQSAAEDRRVAECRLADHGQELYDEVARNVPARLLARLRAMDPERLADLERGLSALLAAPRAPDSPPSPGPDA